MKHSKKIRGMSTALAFAFAFMVFSFSFAPKAYAAEANLSVTYGMNYDWYAAGTVFNRTMSNDGETPISNSQVLYSSNVSQSTSVQKIRPFIITSGTTYHSGPAKLYFSVVYNNGSHEVVGSLGDSDNWLTYYDNHNGVRVESVGLQEISEFTTTTGAGYGYSCMASFRGSEGMPITRLAVGTVSNCGYSFPARTGGLSFGYIFPSIRVISSESSAELDALDNVASEIAAQSDILLAMKGDIVAILQDIYTMTGDMYIAQNQLNGYIEQLLPLIQNIDQTTTNIYRLLSSQLAALETAINTSASTIEAAIEAQTAAMIAYLEEMFNTGNEVPDETYQQQQDAENILDQMESLEKPDVETIVPEIDDYSDGGVSGVMSAIFSSNLIVTMMTLSASLAFGAYVLFGKRS